MIPFLRSIIHPSQIIVLLYNSNFYCVNLQVHGNWRDKLHATSTYALEVYSEQVRSCIEIALSCVDADQCKRPSIGEIIDKLIQMETTIHKMAESPGTSMDQVRSLMTQLFTMHFINLFFSRKIKLKS